MSPSLWGGPPREMPAQKLLCGPFCPTTWPPTLFPSTCRLPPPPSLCRWINLSALSRILELGEGAEISGSGCQRVGLGRLAKSFSQSPADWGLVGKAVGKDGRWKHLTFAVFPLIIRDLPVVPQSRQPGQRETAALGVCPRTSAGGHPLREGLALRGHTNDTPPVPFREGHAAVSLGLCFLWFVYVEGPWSHCTVSHAGHLSPGFRLRHGCGLWE